VHGSHLEVCGARRKDDTPVAELGLDAVRLGGDLSAVASPGCSARSTFRNQIVEYVSLKSARAEAGLHDPLHAPVADELLERGGPLEVTHRLGLPVLPSIESSAMSRRKKSPTVQSVTTRSFRVTSGSW
jgi:hypothetical protein